MNMRIHIDSVDLYYRDGAEISTKRGEVYDR